MNPRAPRDLQLEPGPTVAPLCSIEALAAPWGAWRLGYSWRDYRSTDDPDALHRAAARWRGGPVAIQALHVRWTPGFLPTAARVIGFDTDGAELDLSAGWFAAAADLTLIDVRGAALTGYAIEQAPRGGSAANPNTLRILAVAPILALPPASPFRRVTLQRLDGVEDEALWPTLLDDDPHTTLDVSHGRALILHLDAPTALPGLAIDVVHIGAVGTAAEVRAWAATIGAIDLQIEGAWVATPLTARHVDDAHEGLAAGRVPLSLGWEPHPATTAVRVPLPGVSWSILALHAARPAAPTASNVSLAPPSPRPREDALRAATTDLEGDAFAAAGDWSLAAATATASPQRYSASLGVPGTRGRAGVDPAGGLLLRPGAPAPHACSPAQCLHAVLAMGVDGEAPRRLSTTRRGDPDLPVVTTTAEHQGVTLSLTALGDDPGDGEPPVLRVWIDARVDCPVHRTITLTLGLALRDFHWALPLDLDLDNNALRWPDGSLALAFDPGWVCDRPNNPRDELRLTTRITLGPGSTGRLALALPLAPRTAAPPPTDEAAARARLAAACAASLEGAAELALVEPWGRLTRAALTQAALFTEEGGAVPYGLFPSLYAQTCFGLEEDWLLYGLAAFGATGPALSSLRATYLKPAHLDKKHYLHDLRSGLTPWQTLRLLRLAGRRAADVLTAEELDLLRGCGAWAREQARATAQETGEPHAEGVRVFPGLLKPFRYGGDLGFLTQSLFTCAANALGMECLAELVEPGEEAEGWRREGEAMRAATLAAFDAVRQSDGFYPLHTGGGDPGSYYQLMVAGILDPLDFFAPDDPRAAAMDAHLEATGRLCFGLPRFDDWAGPGPGIDAHYAVGYLLRALRRGRREVFWRGLLGLVAHAMDPEVFTFREVSPLQLDGPLQGAEGVLPGRSLLRSDPCVGGVGVLLMLLRHAMLAEAPGEDGQPSRSTLLALPGVLPEWLGRDGARIGIGPVPTLAGRASVRAWRQGLDLHVEAFAPEVEQVLLVVPDLPGLVWAEGAAGARVPLDRGGAALTLRYAPAPEAR